MLLYSKDLGVPDMNDSVKELCIGENGKLSAKNLRAFLANNLKNEKLVLRVGAFDSTFENDIDYILII